MATSETDVDTTGIQARAGERVIDTRIDRSDSCANLATAAFDALGKGQSVLLVADHDPCGLGYMLQAERPGQTSWEVLEAGPLRWQARLTRIAAAN